MRRCCQIPRWAESHLAAWADVFQKFGAKPKRTPCSADALRKRVLRDGALPALDPVVDLYNAVSLRYAVPVGEKILLRTGRTSPDGGNRHGTL